MTPLIGHAAQIEAFRDAVRQGRLHHAWLLTGPEGVGKASFAERAALRLLAEASGSPADLPGLEVAPDHPAIARFMARAHPDYRKLERPPKDKKDRDKPFSERDPDAERARNIPIEDVRALGAMFALAPTYSSRRVVVIDAIDDLERPSANALLKNLEEPPRDTIFLLVSHAPGRLLPTIRSRCRVLRFQPLDDEEMESVLSVELPRVTPDERAALIAAASGSPGQAIKLAGLELVPMLSALERIAATGDADLMLRHRLASELSGKPAQRRYEAFLERVSGFVAGVAKQRRGEALAAAIDTWDEVRRLANSAVGLSLDPHATVFEIATAIARLAPRERAA